MRAIRVAPAVLLGATALVLSAPAAVADDSDAGHDVTPFGFRVEPATVAAGGRVTLRLDRDGGCAGGATVTSGVFDTVRIPPGGTSTTVTVDGDVRAGTTDRVTFSCDGASGSTDLRIADGPLPSGAPATARIQQVPGAVQAGEGGGSTGDFDLKEIGLGTGLVAGSVAVAYHIARRRAGDDA
ncbi:hypothetical protein AB0F77_29730 [Streptomyces sp. NPDC026672]|uniref:hypothetical protein n=1 Tax=unclassified Streptomyces TaxID=2593676 RepID=UPI0033E2825B